MEYTESSIIYKVLTQNTLRFYAKKRKDLEYLPNFRRSLREIPLRSLREKMYLHESDQLHPNVLSCLANLNNDEVFTPPNLVNDILNLLPAELWSNPNAKF